MLFNEAFLDFVDYAILGIKTFSNSIPYYNLFNSDNIIVKFLSFIMPFSILLSGIYLFIKKDKNLLCFFFYGISLLIIVFPISDDIHFLIGITPLIILIYYLLSIISKNIKNKIESKITDKKYFNVTISFFKIFLKSFICIYLIFYLIYSNVLLISTYLNATQINHNFKHYKQIPISEQLQNKMKSIQEYIISQENIVYILDAEAAIYMISLDRYNKDFDMFNKGNLGSKNEVGIIEELKQLPSGTKLLIKNNKYSKNWQTPMEVIHFVENNFNKIDEINIFDIYEIN